MIIIIIIIVVSATMKRTAYKQSTWIFLKVKKKNHTKNLKEKLGQKKSGG